MQCSEPYYLVEHLCYLSPCGCVGSDGLLVKGRREVLLGWPGLGVLGEMTQVLLQQLGVGSQGETR